jgi:p-aminobenzoyl-glutamate transporter AbgT
VVDRKHLTALQKKKKKKKIEKRKKKFRKDNFAILLELHHLKVEITVQTSLIRKNKTSTHEKSPFKELKNKIVRWFSVEHEKSNY